MTEENENNSDFFTVNDAKSQCLEKLKNASVRMSKQRLEIIDILFSNKFNCTKELFYEVQARNPNLGISTVYRFLKVLNDIGVISNSKMLDVNCSNCKIHLASLKDKSGNDLKCEGLSIQELVRLGLVVKGVINSDEKIDVKMVEDSVHISVQDK